MAALDPQLIGYVQLCDAPLAMPATSEAYGDEAVHGRMAPGDGELPLTEIIAAIPSGTIISAEVPNRQARTRAQSDVAYARTVLRRTRAVIARARAADTPAL